MVVETVRPLTPDQVGLREVTDTDRHILYLAYVNHLREKGTLSREVPSETFILNTLKREQEAKDALGIESIVAEDLETRVCQIETETGIQRYRFGDWSDTIVNTYDQILHPSNEQ